MSEPRDDFDAKNILTIAVVKLIVDEWEPGNEDQLYVNLCELAKSHETLRAENERLKAKLCDENDSISCPICDSEGVIVKDQFTAHGVTVDCEYRKCVKCDQTWVTGRQDSEIDKKILYKIKEENERLKADFLQLSKDWKYTQEWNDKFLTAGRGLCETLKSTKFDFEMIKKIGSINILTGVNIDEALEQHGKIFE